LIAFFVFYMAFEAYKTAEAKRHGLPAPDPLGLDKCLAAGISRPFRWAFGKHTTAYRQ